jgi:hypothetical protein
MPTLWASFGLNSVSVLLFIAAAWMSRRKGFLHQSAFRNAMLTAFAIPAALSLVAWMQYAVRMGSAGMGVFAASFTQVPLAALAIFAVMKANPRLLRLMLMILLGRMLFVHVFYTLPFLGGNASGSYSIEIWIFQAANLILSFVEAIAFVVLIVKLRGETAPVTMQAAMAPVGAPVMQPAGAGPMPLAGTPAMQSVVCRLCGTAAAPGTAYCPGCGSPLGA